MIRRVGSFKFGETKAKFVKFQKEIPIILANNTQNHFLQGFRESGHKTDKSKGGWAPRKSDSGRTGRNVLVDKGDLRADIKRREANKKRVVVGTRNIPYAERHNKGIKVTQREFIGPSKELESDNKKLIERELKKIKP